MYGLVNRGVRDLIISSCGESEWHKVREHAGVDQENFASMETYPDEVTYKLVGSASELLDTPAEDLLKAFGKHWILFTAQKGYGDLIDTWGDNLPEFLQNLDDLHAQLRMSMPHLNPPSFEIPEVTGFSMVLHYISDRPALAPMVIGLLEGLGERFQVTVEAELVSPKSETQPYDEFSVNWSPQVELPA